MLSSYFILFYGVATYIGLGLDLGKTDGAKLNVVSQAAFNWVTGLTLRLSQCSQSMHRLPSIGSDIETITVSAAIPHAGQCKCHKSRLRPGDVREFEGVLHRKWRHDSQCIGVLVSHNG